jgi:hypothetical protein
MRFALYLALCMVGVAFGGEPQTKTEPAVRARPQTKKETEPVQGFAVAPMVLTDEGCARDYVRAFQAEGVELRKGASGYLVDSGAMSRPPQWK